MYAYEIGNARDIAHVILKAVNDAQDKGSENEYVLFEGCLLRAEIDIADEGDKQLCSQAMQVLRRSGHCRYSRTKGAWQFYNWDDKTINARH